MSRLTMGVAIAAMRKGRLQDHNNRTIDDTTKGASNMFNKFRLQACKHIDDPAYDKDEETAKEWEERACDAFAKLDKKRLDDAMSKVKIVSDKLSAHKKDDTKELPTTDQVRIANLENSILTMRKMADENTFKARRTKSSSSVILSIDMELAFADPN